MIWATDKYQKKRNGCGLIILCLLAVWFFIPPLCGVYFFPPYNEPILSGERALIALGAKRFWGKGSMAR